VDGLSGPVGVVVSCDGEQGGLSADFLRVAGYRGDTQAEGEFVFVEGDEGESSLV
jgi:hypothetical protein